MAAEQIFTQDRLFDIEDDLEELNLPEEPFHLPANVQNEVEYRNNLTRHLTQYPRRFPKSFMSWLWLKADLKDGWKFSRKNPGVLNGLVELSDWLVQNLELQNIPALKRRITKGLALCVFVSNVENGDDNTYETVLAVSKIIYNILKDKLMELRNRTPEEREIIFDDGCYCDMSIINNMCLYFQCGLVSPDMVENFVKFYA